MVGRDVRIGRFFGVEVGASWSVLVIAGLLVLGLIGPRPTAAMWVVAGVIVVLFLGCLLAHELAHAVVARRAGMNVKGITLWMLGGVAELGDTMPSAKVELRVALAGPLTSLALAAAFFGLDVLGGQVGVSSLWRSGVGWLAFVNVLLAAFNLVPAAPLDGGRVLAAALWAHHGDRARADVFAAQAGRVFGGFLIVVGVAGLLVGAPFGTLWTALLGWFVLGAATAEQRHARLTGALGDRLVRDVMTPPETVRGWMTVDAFLREAATAPPRQPVLLVAGWDGNLAGVVSVDTLRRVPSEWRGATRVQDHAISAAQVATAHPDERLVDVLSRVPAGPLPAVVVVDGPSIVGLVTAATTASRGTGETPVAEAVQDGPGSTAGSPARSTS